MDGKFERLGYFNLELSKKVAQNYPALSKENFILLFYKNFGRLCDFTLKSDKIGSQKELSKLLAILNVLYTRTTLENFWYIYKELEHYSRLSQDESFHVQEISEYFIDFCGHFWEDEDEKKHFDLGFYKSVTFVFTAIFAYAECFLDGNLTLCYEAKKLIEKENIFL